MLLKKTASVLFACLPLTAYGGQNTTPAVESIYTTEESQYIVIPPIWVEDPRLIKHISAIGSSEIKQWGGELAQYNAAMQEARSKLKIEFKKHRDALEKLKTMNTSLESEEEIDQRIQTLLLENAIVQEEWRHPKSGRLYLWLVIPGF